MVVTIGAGFSVEASAVLVNFSGTTAEVSLSAIGRGAAGAITYAWDTDGDGAYDDLGGANAAWTFSSKGGTHRARVEARDGLGRVSRALVAVRLDKPPTAQQPAKPGPAKSLDGGVFMDSFGRDSPFAASRVNNGLIVLTHGLYSGGKASWLMSTAGQTPPGLAKAIEDRLTSEGRPVPNVVIYDWEADSTPSDTSFAEIANQIVALRLTPQLSPIGIAVAAYGAKLLEDLVGIRLAGYSHGDKLALKLLSEAAADPPRVSPVAPIHLIGHSAGGFVMGQCAAKLREAGWVVDRVTMLDTPFPHAKHLRSLPTPLPLEGTGFTIPPAYLDRYISTVYGNLSFPNAWNVRESSFSSRYFISEGTFRNFALADHEYAHDWYTIESVAGEIQSGFFHSPFLHGPVAPRLAIAPNLAAQHLRALPPTKFESDFATFGSVTVSQGIYTIIEAADAGIFKRVSMSPEVDRLRFKYRFFGAVDGDFLAVRFGAGQQLYAAHDFDALRGVYQEVDLEINQYAGLTNELVFTLVSRGDPGAGLEISGIEIVANDDADDDGLTTADELTLGTDPQLADTDGDGWDDAYEVQVSHTAPTAADTDADGQSDPSEAAAGTDPRDGRSVFAVTAAARLAGGFQLKWNAVPGASYRIVRSTSADFADADVIVSGLAGSTSGLTYIDSALAAIMAKVMFYRVEVE